MKQQQDSSVENIIEVVVFEFIGLDGAVVVHKTIHAVLDVAEIFSISRVVPDTFQALQHDALIVIPLLWFAGFGSH